MSIARPLVVTELRPSDQQTLSAWMSDPAISGPMDLRPPITADMVARGVLPVLNRKGQPDTDVVQIYIVREAGGAMVGFALSYGWDRVDDRIREVDFALPLLEQHHPAAAFEAMARLADACFRREQAIEIRTLTRPGPVGRGLPRVFAGIGAQEVGDPARFHLHSDAEARRVLYVLTAEWFYASRAALRYRLTAG